MLNRLPALPVFSDSFDMKHNNKKTDTYFKTGLPFIVSYFIILIVLINAGISTASSDCDQSTCVNGRCNYDGTCLCHEDWTGDNCHVPRTQSADICSTRVR